MDSRRVRAACGSVALALCLAAPSWAADVPPTVDAPSAPSLLVLPLVAQGTDDQTTAGRLTDVLLSEARSVLGETVAPISADEAAGCVAVDCAVALARARGAAGVVFGSLTRFGDSLSLSLLRADAAAGAVVSSWSDAVAVSPAAAETDASLLRLLQTGAADVLRGGRGPVPPPAAPEGDAAASPAAGGREGSESGPAVEAPGRHRHEGFFLRLSVGLGGNNSLFEDDGKEILDRNFVITPFMLGLGWSVIEDLAIHLDGMFALGGSEGSLVLLQTYAGLGVTWHIAPYNLYLSGSVGAAWFGVGSDKEEFETLAESKTGFGALLSFGKEWWVDDAWGLGLGATLFFIAAPGDPEVDTVFEPTSGRSLSYLLTFTATLN